MGGHAKAVEALDAAYMAIKEIGPNGRDFYPQGPEAMTAATVEHESRLRRLDDIKAELEAMMEGIDAGGAGVDRPGVEWPRRRDEDASKVYWNVRIGVDRLWVIDGFCLTAERLRAALEADLRFARCGEIEAVVDAGPNRAECDQIAASAVDGPSL